MKSKIDSILRKIEKIAEEKAQEIERVNYEKYKSVYDFTARHLRRQKVLLYGGYAINELLPAHLKIYQEGQLPDIDFFTYKPKEVANHLVQKFRKKGLDTASYSEALHPGTYKVFVHGLQVADITGISKAAFLRLSKNSVMSSNGIRIVDPQYLRMSLHMLMSQAVDSHRWSKVFKRLIAFYKVYPPKPCKVAAKTKELPAEMVHTLYDKIQQDRYVLFGARELQLLLNEKAPIVTPHLPPIQILVDADPEVVATNFLQEMKQFGFDMKVHEEDDFIPKHAFLTYKQRKVLGIYMANACVTFNEINHMRVASIHTMLRMYLSMTLSPCPHFKKAADELECITGSLSYLQQKTKQRKRKVLQEFVVDCYGSQAGLITLRREKIMRFREDS
jgi:hypothetical protein